MTVLLVDDEKILLNKLLRLVSEELPQADCHAFTKAQEAIDFGTQNQVDIAFLDIQMRGTDGLEVARRVQEHSPKVNIIFCTDFSEYALGALDLNCSGYLMKPITKDKLRSAMQHLRFPMNENHEISFRCFGNFEAYCNGVPIKFKYSKTKELLAYLVDRNGTSISVGEISAVLFEDDQHRSYLNQLRLDLINTFEKLGVEDVIVQSKGYLGINREKVSCDYFDYLDHKLQVTTREYMTQYSFSEYTYSSLFMDGTYPAIELEE